MMTQPETWPRISTLGVDGFLVGFSDRLTEDANRAALAFRNAVERQNWPAVEESATSLTSTYLRFDALGTSHTEMRRALEQLLAERDWFQAALPEGRKHWRVPTVFDPAFAPQLEDAAQAAGLSVSEAIASISQTRVRVQTIGFAPGQPYLGELPECWDIPRLTKLSEQVPSGALVVAIRQLVLFSVTTPTGWRHIGQTAFRVFRPDVGDPFVLRPGDEVTFEPTTPETFDNMKRDANGGAISERI